MGHYLDWRQQKRTASVENLPEYPVSYIPEPCAGGQLCNLPYECVAQGADSDYLCSSLSVHVWREERGRFSRFLTLKQRWFVRTYRSPAVTQR
jgi:hypothetical protein